MQLCPHPNCDRKGQPLSKLRDFNVESPVCKWCQSDACFFSQMAALIHDRCEDKGRTGLTYDVDKGLVRKLTAEDLELMHTHQDGRCDRWGGGLILSLCLTRLPSPRLPSPPLILFSRRCFYSGVKMAVQRGKPFQASPERLDSTRAKDGGYWLVVQGGRVISSTFVLCSLEFNLNAPQMTRALLKDVAAASASARKTVLQDSANLFAG